VISDLFGTSGRRFLDVLVAGERSPAALAALGDRRLRASTTLLQAALTGRFREVHAFEIETVRSMAPLCRRPVDTERCHSRDRRVAWSADSVVCSSRPI